MRLLHSLRPQPLALGRQNTSAVATRAYAFCVRSYPHPTTNSCDPTAGDNSLLVQWPAVVNQIGFDTVRSYLITVDPLSVPRVPALVVREPPPTCGHRLATAAAVCCSPAQPSSDRLTLSR